MEKRDSFIAYLMTEKISPGDVLIPNAEPGSPVMHNWVA